MKFLFKLLMATAVLACISEWAIILTPDNVKYEDKVCPPQAKPIRYPDGWRIPSCNPTGIVWSARVISK